MDGTNTKHVEVQEEGLPFTEPAPDIWDDWQEDTEEEADFWDEEEHVEDVDAAVEESAEESTQETEPTGGYTAEQQAAIDAEVARQIDAMVAQQYDGYVNPYTGRAITTKAELDAYNQAFAAEEEARRLQAAGIDQNMLNEAVNNHPAIRQAQEILRQQEQTNANNMLANEFAALQREFPDCGLKEARELMATAEGRKAVELWSKAGISLADAYAVAYRTQIQQRQSAAVKQGVMNQMNGKKHLTQTRGGGERAEIPAAVRAEYKKFFPDASDAEISAMYRKNLANDE